MIFIKLGFIFFIIFYFSNKIVASTLSPVQKHLWAMSMTDHADFPTKTVYFCALMVIGMAISVCMFLYGIWIL